MQNVLAIHAIRPEKVFMITPEKLQERVGWINQAIKASGFHLKATSVKVSAMPSQQEIYHATLGLIEQSRQSGLTPVVNFTGGTKLMSIGAWSAATTQQVVSLYIDTANLQVLDGGTGAGLASVLGDDVSLQPYENQLLVSTIARANGIQQVTEGNDFTPYIGLSDYLLANPQVEDAVLKHFNGKKGLFPDGHLPNDSVLQAMVAKPVKLPQAVAELAVASGILEQQGGDFYIHEENRTPDTLRNLVAFFTGLWWEVAVAARMKESGLFSDLRWGANAGNNRYAGSLEEDILAVRDLQVVYVSCKRGKGGARLFRDLIEMRQSADRLGGTHCQRYFAVCYYAVFFNLVVAKIMLIFPRVPVCRG